MAEINKIEIDGVKYTITAPREKVNFLDLDYSYIVEDAFVTISCNQLYENKSIFFDFEELTNKYSNFPQTTSGLNIDVSNFKNCRIIAKVFVPSNMSLECFSFKGFKLCFPNYSGSIDIDGLRNFYDFSSVGNYCTYIVNTNIVFICDIDEYGFCTLTPFNEGEI